MRQADDCLPLGCDRCSPVLPGPTPGRFDPPVPLKARAALDVDSVDRLGAVDLGDPGEPETSSRRKSASVPAARGPAPICGRHRHRSTMPPPAPTLNSGAGGSRGQQKPSDSRCGAPLATRTDLAVLGHQGSAVHAKIDQQLIEPSLEVRRRDRGGDPSEASMRGFFESKPFGISSWAPSNADTGSGSGWSRFRLTARWSCGLPVIVPPLTRPLSPGS